MGELEAFRNEINRIWSILPVPPALVFADACIFKQLFCPCNFISYNNNYMSKWKEVLEKQEAFLSAWNNENRFATYHDSSGTSRKYGYRRIEIKTYKKLKARELFPPVTMHAPTRADMYYDDNRPEGARPDVPLYR